MKRTINNILFTLNYFLQKTNGIYLYRLCQHQVQQLHYPLGFFSLLGWHGDICEVSLSASNHLCQSQLQRRFTYLFMSRRMIRMSRFPTSWWWRPLIPRQSNILYLWFKKSFSVLSKMQNLLKNYAVVQSLLRWTPSLWQGERCRWRPGLIQKSKSHRTDLLTAVTVSSDAMIFKTVMIMRWWRIAVSRCHWCETRPGKNRKTYCSQQIHLYSHFHLLHHRSLSKPPTYLLNCTCLI